MPLTDPVEIRSEATTLLLKLDHLIPTIEVASDASDEEKRDVEAQKEHLWAARKSLLRVMKLGGE